MQKMKTELAEDIVVRFTAPQMIAGENAAGGGAGGRGGGGGGGGVSAAVECGRRLLLAARAGDTDTVRQLMAKGASFTTDWLGTSPLHLAAAHGHAETLGVLLRAGVSRDARTKVERTALHAAAAAGHARAVALLLAAGAAVDARDLLRMTPLHWAVERGHAAAAAALLRAGADPRAESKFRKTPLSLAAAAAAAGRPAMLRLLEDAIRQREAARSVIPITEGADEEPSTVNSTAEPHIVYRIERSPQPESTSSPDAPAGDAAQGAADEQPAGAANEGATEAAALLRAHGITLLPTDDGSTVLSALQSGRTVVLSDAGKLMLKESGAAAGGGGAGGGAAGAAPRGDVVLTATPVSAPPPPGVKVFTLSSSAKVLGSTRQPAAGGGVTAGAGGGGAGAAVPVKLVSLGGGGGGGAATGRGAVRIIMNRRNFRKLIATATRAANAQDADVELSPSSGSESEGEGREGGECVVVVPEQFVRSSEPQFLRSQLLCAHAALQHLARRLHRARRRRRQR